MIVNDELRGESWQLSRLRLTESPVAHGRLPIMMPETAHDIIEITQEPEVNYTEAQGASHWL